MIGNKAKWLLRIWLSVLTQGLAGQTLPSPHYHLDRFLKDPCLSSASVGMAVSDLSTDSIILEHRSDLALPPASLMKLLTTIRALDVLGPDHKFKTILGHSGKVMGDTLHGDLVIRGFGDPTLGSRHHQMNFEILLRHWSQVVISRGIRHITGDVIGDASYFERGRGVTSWPYEDLGNYYGAVPCGLNINDNACQINLRQNQKIGTRVELIDVAPSVPDLSLSSVVTSGASSSGDKAYIIGAPLQSERYIRGTIPIGKGTFTIKGSLPDPPKFLAFHIKNHLTKEGVTVAGQARSDYLYVGPINKLDQVGSMELSEIIRLTNQMSINLYAEGIGMILDKIGSEGLNSESSKEYWLSKGIDLAHGRMVDHCGLAPNNATTAEDMIKVLDFAFKNGALWRPLFASLPVAGESGTLKHMFRNSPAKGAIFAKSGLINGVRNYAGYIKTKTGRWLAFCVLTLNPECSPQVIRKKLEQLLESLYLSIP